MKKNNGFTLIELLAVIVILAIIALIAAPIVLNIVAGAREDAAKRSTEAVINAAKNHWMDHQLDGSGADYITDASKLDVDNPPTSGTIDYDAATSSKVVVTASCLKFGDYWCSYSDDTKAVCVTTAPTGCE